MMRRLSLLCLCAISGITLSMAQQAPIDSVRMYNLGEFEITGQRKVTLHMSKLPVPLAKLPLSVTQISGDEMRSRGIYEIQDAVRFVPGANFRSSYGAFQQLYVRGFGMTPIHYDGMRDERTSINTNPQIDLSSVESIEVLKGPAGVLFGHSAVGGAVNVVRKQATGRNEFFSRVALGSYGYRQANIAKGGRLFGPVNYYTTLNYSNQDGYRRINNNRVSWYGALRAQWDNNDLQLRANYHRDFYATDAGLPKMLRDSAFHADGSLFMKPYQLNPYIKDINVRYNNESDFMYNTGASIAGKYSHRFSRHFNLTDAFMITCDDIDYFSTEALTYPESNDAIYPHYYLAKGKKKYIDLAHVRISSPLRFDHYTQIYQNQLDLNGSFGSDYWKHNYLFGYAVSYMRRTTFKGSDVEGSDPSKFVNPGSPDVYGPGVQSLVSVENPGSMGYMRERFSNATPLHMLTSGVYIQDLMEIGKKLQVMLSLRYDHYTYMSTSVTVIDRKRKFDDPGLDAYRKIVNRALTYRVGAVYEPVDGWQIYGSASSFFMPNRTFYNKRVIYVDANGKEFTPVENQEIFKPLKGYQAEVGTRAEIGNIATLNASVYYIRQYNNVKSLGTAKRMLDGVETDMTISGQVGSVTSKGFELDATVYPMQGMTLSAGYGFTDIRYTKLAKNPYLDVDAEEGNPLTNVPKHNFYTYGSYVFDKGALKGLGLDYSITYTGKIYRDYGRNETYPGYTLVNVGVSHMIAKNITARLQVDNLLDKRVFNTSFGLQMMPNQPRTFNFSVTYHLR